MYGLVNIGFLEEPPGFSSAHPPLLEYSEVYTLFSFLSLSLNSAVLFRHKTLSGIYKMVSLQWYYMPMYVSELKNKFT